MKKTLILAIDFYQKFLYIILKYIFGINPTCRFETSCATYAKQSILKYGPVKGIVLSTSRLLKCQPFYKGALS